MNLGLDVRIQISDELLNLVSDCEGNFVVLNLGARNGVEPNSECWSCETAR